MAKNDLSSVVQGYFPSGVPRQLVPHQQTAIQPRMANTGVRRPPTYHELTIQAHQRNTGLTVQPATAHNGTAFALPPYLSTFGRRPGQQLPPAIQQKMDSFFKTDFSDVRVHVGPEASSIGALAFTQGSNIFFAPGQYNPDSHLGQQLLAHELTHVVQQRAGRVRNPFSSGVAVVQDPALEAEAERMGRQAPVSVIAAQFQTDRFTQTRSVRESFLQPYAEGNVQLAKKTAKAKKKKDKEDAINKSLRNVAAYAPDMYTSYGRDKIRAVLEKNGLRVRGHASKKSGAPMNDQTKQDLAVLADALRGEKAEKKSKS